VSYRVIDPGDFEPTPDRDRDRGPAGAIAGLETLVSNRYTAASGTTVPSAYHHHDEREGSFVGFDGVPRVETPVDAHSDESDG